MRHLCLLLVCLLLPATRAAEPAVAAGGGHSLGLASDGNIYAWGSDGSGQLGLSRTLFRTKGSKVDLPVGSKVSALAAGRSHSLALMVDGSVFTWGENEQGQLGDGSYTTRSTPARIAATQTGIAIAAGKAHSLVLQKDGSVLAWGTNENGELGDDTDFNSPDPVQVVNLPPVTQVRAGYSHAVALDASGRVWTWGDNSYGQLGDEFFIPRLFADEVFLPVKAVRVEAGGDSTFALDSLGRVWSWGRGDNFQLGDGGLNDRATPQLVFGLDKIVSISAGPYDVAAVRSDGTLWYWGGEDYQEPTQITGLQGKAISVSNGEGHILVLLEDGRVISLGNNDSGQLGDGTTESTDTFILTVGLPSMKLVATGLYHSLALARDGTLWAWGNNAQGQLGEASELEYNLPRLIRNFSGVSQIASGELHSLALKTDGSVWAWGSNYYGALGDGTERDRSSPVKVLGLPVIRKISAGSDNSVAIATDGTVWTWGTNHSGELGINNKDIYYSVKAIKVPTLTSITEVAVGESFMLGLKSDGTVWAWGENGSGQLGLGDKTQRDIPQRIPTLSDVIAVAAGKSHALALKRDGTVWAWGNGVSGQLGNTNSPTNQLLPVQVGGLSGVKAIDAGERVSTALTTNGRIFAWGENYEGELGNEIDFESRVPAMAEGENFASISVGSWHTLTLKTDGSAWGFGWNYFGQMGDGTFDDKYTHAGIVNSQLTAFLDLAPGKTKLPIPAGKLPPFLVETTKIGSLQKLSLIGSIGVNGFASAPPPPLDGQPGSKARSNGSFSAGFNVYVAAIIPGAPATASAPERPVSLFLKTQLASWQPYLGGPLTEYLRGVSESSDKRIVVDILSSTDISSLVGTKFLLGYGVDSEEMIRAGRYRVVYEVGNAKP